MLWLGQSDCVVHETLHVPPGYIVEVRQVEPPAQPAVDEHGPPTTLPSRPTPVGPQAEASATKSTRQANSERVMKPSFRIKNKSSSL
jgi:hypothetical protein